MSHEEIYHNIYNICTYTVCVIYERTLHKSSVKSQTKWELGLWHPRNHTQCGMEEAHTESTGCPFWYND